jgi:hypothetical protein
MKTRKTIEVSERFNKRWLGYAAAAGAAGVGVLGGAQPANADIIYTLTNTPVSGTVSINMDGVTALSLTNHASVFGTCFPLGNGGCLWHEFGGARMSAGGPNVIMAGQGNSVAQLPRGAYLGASLAMPGIGGPVMASERGNFGFFASSNSWNGHSWRHHRSSFLGPLQASQAAGQWGGGNGYLGFEFLAPDGWHYGWASVDVGVKNITEDFSYQETLIGYAYNTVPGQPLLAGQEHYQPMAPTPEPGTLGLLAIGSLGLGLWRRRKAVGSKQ